MNKIIDFVIDILIAVKYALGTFIVKISGRKKESQEILNSLHNKYKGQRCFILGNGPSLTPEDLNLLKDEVTFASNRIYNIFSKTDWRPTYFAMFDENVAEGEGVAQGVSGMDCIKFVREQGYLSYKNIDGQLCFVHSIHERSLLDNPKFSEDLLSNGIYTIATVTYSIIQIARWMGFSEMYLLGMDNRYKFSELRDGTIVRNENVLDYFGEEVKKEPLPSHAIATWEMDVAYEYADKYSREHGFRIYNATRGGFLEKFERVNLDEILKKGTEK